MLLKLDYRRVAPFLLVATTTMAQDADLPLDQITAESCTVYAGQTPEELTERIDVGGESTIAALLVDAVLLQCASLGAIPAPERPDEQQSRTATGIPEVDEASQLAAEARYLVETAMQIDPDASNDLLRRLLGPRPGDEG